MSERPRKNHFGAKIAERTLRAKALLEDEPQYQEPEYEYPGDRFKEHLRNIEEKMRKDEAGD